MRRERGGQLQRSIPIQPRLLWVSILGIALFYGVLVGEVSASEWSSKSRWRHPQRDGQPYTKARVKELRYGSLSHIHTQRWIKWANIKRWGMG